MRKTYLFYDVETSGLNKCFDQVLQFAAIRTDLDLNEISRHEFFIKLNPDVIPSPEAVLVHQIGLDEIKDGMNEYEAMKEIHGLFNTLGTISVGYNTLGFDDEFLRFSFYRNLLSPYTHQFANGCSRMDIYPMAVMYYLYKQDTIVWPKIEGVPSLKLEHLNVANNLAVGKSHEAMCDVEATIELARLMQKEKEMWDYLVGCFDKKIDLARLNKLDFIDGEYQQALLIDGVFGVGKNYQVPVIGLGIHNYYKNQSLWLPLDSVDFSEADLNDIGSTIFVNRKRFGEPPILLPLTARFSKYLDDERLRRMKRNAAWIKENKSDFLKIVEYHKEYKYPEIPNLDIDAALYQNGFISDSERIKCNKFNSEQPQEKLSMVEEFYDKNLRIQAIRILGKNYPEILSKEKKLNLEFKNYLDKIYSNEVIVDYKNQIRLSPKSALAKIEVIKETTELSNIQQELLESLVEYIRSFQS